MVNLDDDPDSVASKRRRSSTTPSPLIETRGLASLLRGLQTPVRDSQTHLFVFSAHEQKALSQMIQAYASYTGNQENAVHMENLAYTLGCRRTKMQWRTSVVAQSPEDLVLKLTGLQPRDFIRTSEDGATRVSFVFAGQGAQWFAMGRELLGFDIFLESIVAATSYLETYVGCRFNLLVELLRDESSSRINQPEVSQPATTAIQVALVDLLMKYFGISPSSVCGHSSGEIAAAYAMGALSREQAWELAFHRGHCASTLQDSGGEGNPEGRMLAVGLSASEAHRYVDRVNNNSVTVACINSPASVTLSGDSDAIQELQAVFQAEGIFNRLLVINIAYHSHHMRRCESAYLDSIAHIMPKRPNRTAVPHPNDKGRLVTPGELSSKVESVDLPASSKVPIMYSCVTGHAIGWEELCPEYWVRNMVCPVLFSDAMHQMVNHKGDGKPSMILELSPHASLQGPVKQILDTEEKLRQRPLYTSALRRGKDAAVTLLEAVGSLWGRGCDIVMPWVIMRNAQIGRPKLLVDLPKYPWNHDNRYWHESHLSEANRFQVHGRYDLIGRPTADSVPFQPRWRGFFRVAENPWIRDHQVQKTIIYPAAGMIAMVLEAAKQMASGSFMGIEIMRFRILKAMIIPPTSHGLEYAINLSKQTNQPAATPTSKAEPLLSAPSTKFQFSIYSKQLNKSWEEHGDGFVTIHYRQPAEGARAEHQRSIQAEECYQTYLDAKNECDELVIPRQLYETLDVIGMNYGPLFQNIEFLHKRDNICVSVIRIPDTKSVMPAEFEYPHIIHPATLDSIFQTAFAIDSEPMVPSFFGSIYISTEAQALSGTREQLVAYTRADRRGLRDATASFIVSDDSWLGSSGPRQIPLIMIKDMIFTALTPSPVESGFLPNHHNLCSEIAWEKLDLSANAGNKHEAFGNDNYAAELTNRILVLVPEDPSPGINRLCAEIARTLDCQFRTLDSIHKGEMLLEFCISLLEADGQAFIWGWTEHDFLAFRTVTAAAKGMFWITRGSQLEATNPKSSLVQALGRTIHSEYPRKRLVSFDVDIDKDFSDSSVDPLARLILSLFTKSFFGPRTAKPMETEYIERKGQVMVPRLVPIGPLNSMVERGSALTVPELQHMPAPHERPLKLEIGEIGDTGSLYWSDDSEACLPLSSDDVKVRVMRSMISDLDKDIVHGRVQKDSLGTGVYGVVEQIGKNVENVLVGDRVVCIAHGSLRDYVRCHHRLLFTVDEHMFEPRYLYLPTSFSVAKYALGDLGVGDTVLIHAGASLFGQAAIQLAKSAGATVFASARTNNQRGILRQFWNIPESHIFDERTDVLVDEILRLTDRKGVNVIYDPVARSRDSNVLCVREGRFLYCEITKCVVG